MKNIKLKSTSLAIYNYITDCNVIYGYSPTIQEIGSALGLKSTTTIYGHIQRLIRNGYLNKNSICLRKLVSQEYNNKKLFEFLISNNFKYKVNDSKIIIDLK